ncbi:MAG: hypothetical protein ABFC38_14085 [Methanospirillum sp.]
MDWKWVRVYMTMEGSRDLGPGVRRVSIQALVIFEVTEVRPIVDMGRGWEPST